MLPLTGTRSREHMRQDLAAPALELRADEVALIETVGSR
jgi:aryl-alcohol dehydrogenase-like predicted oxidoreductase